MASSYPGAFDSFSTTHATGETIQAGTDNDQADAINKIERELGINPSGSEVDVTARFAVMDFFRALNGKGWINHGSNANAIRPGGYASVEWFGSVAPVNAVDGDTWIDTNP